MVEEYYLEWSRFGHALHSACSPEFGPLNATEQQFRPLGNISVAAGDLDLGLRTPNFRSGDQYFWRNQVTFAQCSRMSAPRARKSKSPSDLSAAQAPAPPPPQHSEDVNSLSSTKDVRLAEYKALRDESLRCAQLFANAVWVAVTGYAVTVGVGAAFLGKAGGNGRQVREDFLLTGVLCLLCVEALAISTMYLSELWKYIRIGTYIRQYIEPQLSEFQLDTPPMNWERWIKKHRAKELYIGALTLLQLPVILAVVGGLAAKIMSWSAPSPALRGSVVEFIGWLTSDRLLGWCLAVVIALDVLVVIWLGTRVILAERGTFDPPTSPAGWRALRRPARQSR